MKDDTETQSLRFDVACVLVECHKDRPAMFAGHVSRLDLQELASIVAAKLGPRIGGRYIPKMADREAREERNAAVCEAFSGRNHAQVMKQFNISRRLLYSILASRRRTSASSCK